MMDWELSFILIVQVSVAPNIQGSITAPATSIQSEGNGKGMLEYDLCLLKTEYTSASSQRSREGDFVSR